jgi:signal transduction histidine kinase
VTADANLIRLQRHDEIGALIQRDTAQLIEQWRRRAALEQPGAARLHEEALLDHLPALLAQVGVYLADSSTDDRPHCRPASQHGEQRWEVGWSLTEVVRDYRILRLVVLDYLDRALQRPLHVREVQAVGLALDEAIAASVERYVRSREEQLQQTRTALQEADRRKNEFLATLAHELRNPLAPLRNSLEVLRLSGNSPQSVGRVREIMDRQVQQMTHLVEDLLDVTRIAQGKLVLRKERFDVRVAVEQAVQMNAPLRESRRHKLSVSLPAGPLWFEGDQARLVQVVVNLLNNAAKYTPDGGHIDLSASQNGSRAVIRVKDNGVGIPPDKLAHVFDLFAQLDLGPERAEGGLGIGLTLVRRLVELQGGTIAATSAGAGQGSEFMVHLPLPAEQAAPVETGASPTGDVAARHFLIVEDNVDNRESLAVLLRLLGHRVDAAEDGLRGLELARAARPQIALVDIGLPDINGFEVARRLRQELGDAVLLVALTGHSQPEDRQRAIEAGFNAHLIKPVDLEALFGVVRRGH